MLGIWEECGKVMLAGDLQVDASKIVCSGIGVSPGRGSPEIAIPKARTTEERGWTGRQKDESVE